MRSFGDTRQDSLLTTELWISFVSSRALKTDPPTSVTRRSFVVSLREHPVYQGITVTGDVMQHRGSS